MISDRKKIDRVLGSDINREIALFFYKNLNSIDTVGGIAMWTGCNPEDVKKSLDELVSAGVLNLHESSSLNGYSCTRNRKILKMLKLFFKE